MIVKSPGLILYTVPYSSCYASAYFLGCLILSILPSTIKLKSPRTIMSQTTSCTYSWQSSAISSIWVKRWGCISADILCSLIKQSMLLICSGKMSDLTITSSASLQRISFHNPQPWWLFTSLLGLSICALLRCFFSNETHFFLFPSNWEDQGTVAQKYNRLGLNFGAFF